MAQKPIDRSGQSIVIRTFLIADVRGYTRFTRERGDAAAAALARRFADLARDAVEARGGRVIELRGDEALAVFDASPQAVRAAVEFQATCAEESEADPAFPLPVGIGIDTGEAVPVEDGYRGVALNMAARLCSNAGAGQVFVTRTIVEQAEATNGEIRFLERGPATFKGFEQAIDVIEAVAGEAPGRPLLLETTAEQDRGIPPELDPLTPLVDREHEMWWLRGTWRQVRRGRGRVLFVSGPAQIGKTRLAGEIAGHVHAGGDLVRYAGPGGAATAVALSAIREAAQGSEPMLLVLDDVDVAGPQVAQALLSSYEEVSRRPVLALALVRDPAAGPDLTAVIERADQRGDGHRALAPLDLEGVRGIVRLYVGDGEAEAPVESMARASHGVPGRIHEVVSEWARSEASRRLAAAAEFLAQGRDRHASDLEFANNVIGLKLGRLYSVEGRDVLAAETCPYKGLAQFEEDDSASFFGRERLVGELAARTVQVGLLGVVGASGSGKSSAIAAGLLPSLRAGLLPGSEQWTQVSMRPGEHPMVELRTALSNDAEDPLEAATLAVPSGGRLVLVVDQFEETFTTCATEEECAAFVDALTDAAKQWPERVAVVLAIRGDYYAHCAPYPELAEALAANHVLVGPLTREELRRAIELPARRAGLRVESSLVDAMVEEIADEPGGLPLLSTALVELWQAREGGWIRMEAYERTGGIRGAVSRLAESSYEQLSDAEQEAARRVFLRLVATGEGEAVTRRRVLLDEFDLDRDDAAAGVIARLTQDRLLTMGQGTVEVAHEALLREWPRLQGWLEEDAQGRLLRQHLTQASRQWQGGGREPSELYRGARLSATLDWSTLHGRELNDLEREFVGASRDASEREAQRQRRTNRRLRGLLVGVAAFLVLALVAGSLALVQRGQARRSAQVARAQGARARREAIDALSQRLGAQALDQKDLPLSLLLAREGVAIHDSVQTRGYLLSALERSPDAVRVFRPLPGRYLGGSATPDGREFLVGLTNDEQWALVQAGTGRVLRRGTTVLAALSADGTEIGLVNTNQTQATVLDAATGHVLSSVNLPSRFANNLFNGGAWSPDLRTFVFRLNSAVTPNTPTNMYAVDTRTGGVSALPPSPRGPKAEQAVQFSPDGRYIATVSLTRSLTQFITVWRTGRYRQPVRVLVRSSTDQVADSLAISHNDRFVAVGGGDGSITVYDLQDPTGRGRVFSGRHNAGVNALAFPPDDRTLVSAGADEQVLVWDVASGALRQTLDGHTGAVNSVSLTSDGKTIFTASADGSVIEWDLSGTRSLGHRTQIGGGSQGFSQTFVTASADGTLAASPQDSVTPDANVVLLGGAGLTPVRTVPIGAVAVALSPDGRTLAVATHLLDANNNSIGPRITLWDTSTGQLVADLTGPPKFVVIQGQKYGNDAEGMAFSPDGHTLAGIDDHAVIYLWDVASHGLTRTISGTAHPGASNGGIGVAFSPNGFLAAAYSGAVTTWRLPEMKALYTLKLDAKPLAFSPDGKLLAAGGNDGAVHLFDAAGGRALGSPIAADAGPLETVAFSPDGRTMVAAGRDGSARLIDLASRTQIGQPLTGGGVDGGAIFWNRGSTVEMVDANGGLYSWRISSKALEDQACSVAGRSLTRSEWREFMGDRPYQPVCPSPSATS